MMISLKRVTKLYGIVIGVNDINLELPAGAYGLLGPNGSGKTTLLNLITGQLRPSQGSVGLFDSDPFRDTAPLGQVGLCPAMDILPTDVTGFEWVKYMMQLQGFDPAEAARLANQALDQVRLDDARSRDIAGYSRGMKQRVKLAQAIAHEPNLLILDEPMAGLDPVARRDMTDLLRQWISNGKSILMASHILYEVEAVADNFLLIHGGRLLASGSTDEIYSLLEDVPRQIDVVCDDAARLAVLIQKQGCIDSVQFHEGGEGLTMFTRRPLEVYQQLPVWIEEEKLTIKEVISGDESLQTLFETLMQIHRGQV